LSASRFGSSKRDHVAGDHAAEVLGDALARDVPVEHLVPLGAERDQAHVGRVALVARARVRDVEQSGRAPCRSPRRSRQHLHRGLHDRLVDSAGQ
jgi:hypothetical protein